MTVMMIHRNQEQWYVQNWKTAFGKCVLQWSTPLSFRSWSSGLWCHTSLLVDTNVSRGSCCLHLQNQRKLGTKYGKIHREVTKEAGRTKRSRCLSRPMGIVHRTHEHLFFLATMSATQQTVKKIKRYPFLGPQLIGTGKWDPANWRGRGHKHEYHNQTNKNMLYNTTLECPITQCYMAVCTNHHQALPFTT